MSEDYRSMLAKLGFDLSAHDALLGVRGRRVLIPENPQFIAALGVALLASYPENTLIE